MHHGASANNCKVTSYFSRTRFVTCLQIMVTLVEDVSNCDEEPRGYKDPETPGTHFDRKQDLE